MSTKNTEISTVEQAEITEEALLPPRHIKHGKRNMDSQEGEVINLKGRKRSFLYIQIILYTFLAMIAAIIIFYYVDERNQQQSLAGHQVDPLVKFLQEQEQNKAVQEPGSKPETNEAVPSVEEPVDHREAVLDNEDESGDGLLADAENPVGEPSSPPKEGSKPETESAEPKIMAVHTVQPGETLYRITIKYYHSKEHLNYLAAYNGIQDPTKDIKVGMTIKIPEKP